MIEAQYSQIASKMGGFATFADLIIHMGYTGLDSSQEFPNKVKRELRLLSQSSKNTQTPCCMFPGCSVHEPPMLLEFHHFKPKEFGGHGTLDNALLLCPNHHKITKLLCFLPSDVDYIQKGIWHPSVYEYMHLSLKEIWHRLYYLYGFPNFSNESDVMSRFAKIVRIRQSIICRRSENEALWYKLMGWTAIMISLPLIVLLKSKLYYEARSGQPKNFIQSLLKDAESYSIYAEDSLLTAINLHLLAINLNALGSFSVAKQVALLSEKSIARVHDHTMPINMDSYKYYIKSQNAVIVSKMGDGKGLDLSKKSLVYSLDKSPDQYIESICRHLQVSILLGEIDECKYSEALIVKAPKAENPDKEIQKLKALSYLRMCQGDIKNEFEYFTSKAKNMAIKHNRYHSLGKIEALIRFSENKKLVREKCGFNRAHSPNTASFLASLL